MIIEQSPHLNILLNEQIDKIVKSTEVGPYTPGSVIVKSGTPKGQHMWLIVKGKIQGVDGFASIGDADFAAKSTACFEEDVVAEEESVVGCISLESFESCIGGPLTSVVEGNKVMMVLKNVPLLRNLAPT